MSSVGHPLVVLDVPLLYETGLEAAVDAVVVVSAPEDVQRLRVLSRPGMMEERFAAILSRQVGRGAPAASDTGIRCKHAVSLY